MMNRIFFTVVDISVIDKLMHRLSILLVFCLISLVIFLFDYVLFRLS